MYQLPLNVQNPYFYFTLMYSKLGIKIVQRYPTLPSSELIRWLLSKRGEGTHQGSLHPTRAVRLFLFHLFSWPKRCLRGLSAGAHPRTGTHTQLLSHFRGNLESLICLNMHVLGLCKDIEVPREIYVDLPPQIRC